MLAMDSPPKPTSTSKLEIIFSRKDFIGVLPHEDDPMVISIQLSYWDVKCVLVNLEVLPASYIRRFQLDMNHIYNHSRLSYRLLKREGIC